MHFKSIAFLAITCVFSVQASAHHKDVIVIDNSSESLKEKEAILILPGFGSKVHGVKDIRNYFSHKGYDLYIPHYIGRDSLGECVITLDKFINAHQLLKYKKLHVFSYIAGSWVLNLWLQRHPVNNIASVVYDRSPWQERAPYVLIKDNPLIMKLVVGNIMKDFACTAYPEISNDAKRIGIIIENKATKLIRRHKKRALSLGRINFKTDYFEQSFDDCFYECIDHDELYYKFETIGKEIFYFFRNGHFSPEVRKEPFDFDPFDKHSVDCKNGSK